MIWARIFCNYSKLLFVMGICFFKNSREKERTDILYSLTLGIQRSRGSIEILTKETQYRQSGIYGNRLNPFQGLLTVKVVMVQIWTLSNYCSLTSMAGQS